MADQYEKKDVNVSKIVGFTVAIIILLTAILIFMMEYFIYSREKMVYENVLKPESVELRELRAKEDRILHSYEVVDEEKGVYRIPIDRAMKIVADEAYRARKERALR